MASFEAKVSEIFNENPRLARKIPVVIRQLFQESEFKFKHRLKNEAEDVVATAFLRLYDTLYIDFYFDKLNDRFLNWVIEHYPERFSESELDEMRAQSKSHLDFYEVQKVLPGKGSYIKSLFTNHEGFLKDVSSSSSLVKWDIILARCYYYHNDYYATGSLALFRPIDKKFILNRIKQEQSDYSDISRSSGYADFAKNRWDIFYQIEREMQEREKNKKFYTKYGELQLCEVRFQVQDVQTILATINSCEEFDFIETRKRTGKKKKRNITRYQFDWFTLGIEEELQSIKTEQLEEGLLLTTSQLDLQGNQTGVEVIGALYVDQFLCRLETRSVELAEFAVRHFAGLFGDALTFKRIVKKKTDTSPKHKVSEETEEPLQSNLTNSELTNLIGEKYYLSLLDEKIPALNNRTPREARQDPALRPLLIEWLKGMENMFERNRLEGKEFVSIDKIKKVLEVDW